MTRPIRLGGYLEAERTLSHEHVIESAVLASQIEQLPDLTGFLKFASQPHWREVTLARE